MNPTGSDKMKKCETTLLYLSVCLQNYKKKHVNNKQSIQVDTCVYISAIHKHDQCVFPVLPRLGLKNTLV